MSKKQQTDSTNNDPKGEEAPQKTLSRIIAERQEKAQQLVNKGYPAYRNDIVPTHTCLSVRETYEGKQTQDAAPGIRPVDGTVVRLAGRVMARRGFGKTVFAPITDRTGSMQLFLNNKHLEAADFSDVLPVMDVGDWVAAEGAVFFTKRGEMSILCTRLWLVTKSLRPLPDKWHGLKDVETRYRKRYVDLAANREVAEVFRKRSQLVRGVRRFLDERGYLEVETPMMHSMVGGAAARPFVTHHNALDMPLYMRIAPELYLKRLLVGGFGRVYEINRNFRNEGLSRQHNPEFTMLEFYQAYATYLDLMPMTEELVRVLCEDINNTSVVVWEETTVDVSKPWQVLSVRDAVLVHTDANPDIFDNASKAASFCLAAKINPANILQVLLQDLDAKQMAEVCQHHKVSDTTQLLAQLEQPPAAAAVLESLTSGYSVLDHRIRAGHLAYLVFDEHVETKLQQPTFLTEFPVAVSPLARKKDGDPAYVDRFELFVCGHEIANAFSELNDPVDQRGRFAAQVQAKTTGADETMDYDEDYCCALEVGMPPAAGEGIGIDRLTMFLTGQSSIRDVILFPHMRPDTSA